MCGPQLKIDGFFPKAIIRVLCRMNKKKKRTIKSLLPKYNNEGEKLHVCFTFVRGDKGSTKISINYYFS